MNKISIEEKFSIFKSHLVVAFESVSDNLTMVDYQSDICFTYIK